MRERVANVAQELKQQSEASKRRQEQHEERERERKAEERKAALGENYFSFFLVLIPKRANPPTTGKTRSKRTR